MTRMRNTLSRLRQKESGFLTAIEVALAVLVIGGIGVVFLFLSTLKSQREAVDETVTADMKVVVAEIENTLANNSDNNVTVSVTGSVDLTKVTLSIEGSDDVSSIVSLSKGVRISGSGTEDGYTILGQHPDGQEAKPGKNDDGILYDSAQGGF